MPLILSYVVIVLAGIALFGIPMVRFEQWIDRRRKRAKDRLLTYLNIGEGTYQHSRNDLWDSTGVIEESLVAHAHAKAKRGMYLAQELSDTGAITIAKRDEAKAYFQTYLFERQCKKAVPRRLPEVNIETQDDPSASWAADKWQRLGRDLAELRWILRLFSTAFNRDRVDAGG